MDHGYEAPKVVDYGELEELTEAILGSGPEDAAAKAGEPTNPLLGSQARTT